jgi:hypothetical protein
MMSLLALKIAPKERFFCNNIKLKGIKFKTFKTKQNKTKLLLNFADFFCPSLNNLVDQQNLK